MRLIYPFVEHALLTFCIMWLICSHGNGCDAEYTLFHSTTGNVFCYLNVEKRGQFA